MPSARELIDAWVTLSLLHGEAITGQITNRRFDTPTACNHAQTVIATALERTVGDGYAEILWAALDERNAAVHA